MTNGKRLSYYLKRNGVSTKAVLDFLLQVDPKLAKKYKDRKRTVYTLLTKYVKKHIDNTESGVVKNNITPKKYESKESVHTKVQSNNKAVKKIESAPPTTSSKNSLNNTDNKENELKQKMIDHYGKEHVDTVGVEMSKVVYDMMKSKT